MANFVNLTPHVLNIVKSDGSTMTIEPSGKIARVTSKQINIDVSDDTFNRYIESGTIHDEE